MEDNIVKVGGRKSASYCDVTESVILGGWYLCCVWIVSWGHGTRVRDKKKVCISGFSD